MCRTRQAGSWDKTEPSGYAVVSVPFEPSGARHGPHTQRTPHTVHTTCTPPLGALLTLCSVCGAGANHTPLGPPTEPLGGFRLDPPWPCAVNTRATHGALPHRAPSSRRTAELVHHVWHRRTPTAQETPPASGARPPVDSSGSSTVGAAAGRLTWRCFPILIDYPPRAHRRTQARAHGPTNPPPPPLGALLRRRTRDGRGALRSRLGAPRATAVSKQPHYMYQKHETRARL